MQFPSVQQSIGFTVRSQNSGKGLLALSCMSVCLSFLREQLRFHWTYFNESRYYQHFSKIR